ncbi:MAG: hypothetical protein K6G86_03130 [Bacteroidales bacterium]|nr:hypothetical protein [Bacteroidales bacterium]
MRPLYAKTAFLLSLALGLSAACDPLLRSHVAATLDNVETYINDRPDSALVVLRALDSTAVCGRALQARTALLHSMALDKCYIDLQTDSILAPAVSWYERHGSPDDKLKTLYYLGRILQNQRDFEQAAAIFATAESFIPKANDARMAGLVYLAESVLFRDSFNTEKEIEYIEKGNVCFKSVGDSSYINRGDARLAMAYHRKKDWKTADSLFRTGLASVCKDSVFYCAVLSDYARMKVLQPEPDPSGALALLDEKYYDYHRPFRVDDIGVYAFSHLLSSKSDGALVDKYLDYLYMVKGSNQKDALYWIYRIEQVRGNSDLAINAMNKAYARQVSIYEKTLDASVSRALLRQSELREQAARQHSRMISFLLITSLLALIAIIIAFLLWQKQHKLREETQRREVEYRLEAYTSTIEDLETRLSDVVKETHTAMDLGFDTMDKLCESYYTSGHTKYLKLLSSFELLIERFRKDKEYQQLFQKNVDTIHGGILSMMRDQLDEFHEEDFSVLALVISGLSYNSISVILDTNKANAYNRVTRLRQRIEKSGAQNKDLFLAALRKTPAFKKK